MITKNGVYISNSKSYLIGYKRLLHSPWILAYYIVLAISFGDCALSLSFKCTEV
jgi:hypothetical protein